jgi:hypothetical protein
MQKFMIPALLVAMAGILPADVLRLRDGRSINGRMISASSRQIQFMEEGQRTARAYSLTNVDRISFGDTAAIGNSNRTPATSSGNGSYNSESRVPASSTRPRTGSSYSIPAGSVIRLRMIDPVNSDKTDIGDTYKASLDSPIVVDSRTLAPRGADATVRIARVEDGGLASGKEEIALVLNDLMINGRRYRVESQDTSVTNDSRTKENATVIGGGAVLGAIIGAIAGGGKGAAIGAATGAGAGAAAQVIRGEKIEIPSEALLEFRLAEPLYVN